MLRMHDRTVVGRAYFSHPSSYRKNVASARKLYSLIGKRVRNYSVCTRRDGVKNRDKAYYSKLSHMLPHVISGGVLRISNDGDDRRIFWGFEIFDSGK